MRDLRNIGHAEVDLSAGINVFVGRNAQGKTTLLEAVGLLARGRSFRTDATETLIRRGAGALVARGFAQEGREQTRLDVEVTPTGSVEAQRALAREIEARRPEEQHRRVTLSGPHRDEVHVLLDGGDAAEAASSGQARSALLALTLAAAEISREERGRPATLLLDDLDSELDEQRTRDICEAVAARAQALVTTAHPAWAQRLDGLARRFDVDAGRVVPA